MYRAWPSPALVAVMLGLMLAAVASTLVGEFQPWLLTAYALAVVGLALQLVQNWRWRLVTHDEGITVDSGFGKREHVDRDEVEAIRTWPSAVKSRSRRRIRLLLQPRKLRELERLAAEAQGEPEGALLEGSDRLNPARAFMLGGAPRFLLVVLLGVPLAILLLARSLRAIVVGSLIVVAGMAAVAATLWVAGFRPFDAAAAVLAAL